MTANPARSSGPADRGELGDDVLAVPAFLDHPQHPAELALRAA